jgi:hypothetical protein
MITSAIVVAIFGCASFPRSVSRPIVNSTGVAISQVYIRDSESANWGTKVNQRARTTTKTVYTQQGSYQQTVYVTNYDGSYIYDTYDLNNGETYPYSFRAPGASDGQTPQYKSIDVKFIDDNGVAYGKNNVNLTHVESIVITKNDMYPILTMQNNTGFPINISIKSESTGNINDGSSARYQIDELTDDRRHVVSYSIGDYRFDKEVMLNNHTTLSLTDRPPTVIVKNNTGYPITINKPFSQSVADGSSSDKYPKSSRNANKQIISYSSGTYTYNKEVMINDEDVILTLTENDRPPVITIVNNIGNTVNMVFIRDAGADWGNSVTSGTSADVRLGSFTNKESKRIWLGLLPGLKPDRYDLRLDDIQNNSYVKFNEQITKDMTVTFTPKDKP